MDKIKVFNIKPEGNCDSCVHGKFSDLYECWLCDLPADTHILYPENGGTNNCEFKVEGRPLL